MVPDTSYQQQVAMAICVYVLLVLTASGVALGVSLFMPLSRSINVHIIVSNLLLGVP